jgi:hypothetical protein
MILQFRASVRLGAGMVLIIAGVLFWILLIVLPLTSLHVRLLTSLGHVERQSLPIIVGGASLVGGIIFFLAPPGRRRRRYSDQRGRYSDQRDSFCSLAPTTTQQRRVSEVPRLPATISIGEDCDASVPSPTGYAIVTERGEGAATGMSWTSDDAERHTHKARTRPLKELWAKVANDCLERTGDEGRAVRDANAVVAWQAEAG